jgi:hypothetical protein
MNAAWKQPLLAQPPHRRGPSTLRRFSLFARFALQHQLANDPHLRQPIGQPLFQSIRPLAKLKAISIVEIGSVQQTLSAVRLDRSQVLKSLAHGR